MGQQLEARRAEALVTDALTQQLGKCRSLQAEAAKDDLREMVHQVIREELRAV